MQREAHVVVVADQPESEGRARDLARRLGLPLASAERPEAAGGAADAPLRSAAIPGAPVTPEGAASREPALELRVSTDGLSLARRGSAGKPVAPDLGRLVAARPGRDDLLRAVTFQSASTISVVDATAGLGTDGFLLAARGCRVTMIERSPVLHAMLEDALARALASAEAAVAAGRIALLAGDARHLLPTLPRPDVVYLDPMYPDLGKSAASAKEMEIFRELVGGDRDAAELLEAARRCAVRRVVVKRPIKAPPLAPAASGSIRGRSTRFDLYAGGRVH